MRSGIVQHAFQTVTHLDAQRAVILGDQQQRAVIHALASELPCLDDADAVLFDGLRLGGRHDQHRKLRALLRFEVGEPGFKRLYLSRIQRGGQVGDAMGERRHSDIGVRRSDER